jgi:hypothetical protein
MAPSPRSGGEGGDLQRVPEPRFAAWLAPAGRRRPRPRAHVWRLVSCFARRPRQHPARGQRAQPVPLAGPAAERRDARGARSRLRLLELARAARAQPVTNSSSACSSAIPAARSPNASGSPAHPESRSCLPASSSHASTRDIRPTHCATPIRALRWRADVRVRPVATSRPPTSCLCTAFAPSSRVALLLLVLGSRFVSGDWDACLPTDAGVPSGSLRTPVPDVPSGRDVEGCHDARICPCAVASGHRGEAPESVASSKCAAWVVFILQSSPVGCWGLRSQPRRRSRDCCVVTVLMRSAAILRVACEESLSLAKTAAAIPLAGRCHRLLPKPGSAPSWPKTSEFRREHPRHAEAVGQPGGFDRDERQLLLAAVGAEIRSLEPDSGASRAFTR